jgi:hypothetical protein
MEVNGQFHFPARERALGTHRVERRVGLRAGQKHLLRSPWIGPCPTSAQLVAIPTEPSRLMVPNWRNSFTIITAIKFVVSGYSERTLVRFQRAAFWSPGLVNVPTAHLTVPPRKLDAKLKFINHARVCSVICLSQSLSLGRCTINSPYVYSYRPQALWL